MPDQPSDTLSLTKRIEYLEEQLRYLLRLSQRLDLWQIRDVVEEALMPVEEE